MVNKLVVDKNSQLNSDLRLVIGDIIMFDSEYSGAYLYAMTGVGENYEQTYNLLSFDRGNYLFNSCYREDIYKELLHEDMPSFTVYRNNDVSVTLGDAKFRHE